MKNIPIILSLCLFISSLSVQAQLQEEEYDDVYFFAKDHEAIAKNDLIKAQKRAEFRENVEKQLQKENKQQVVQPRQSLHFNHDLSPQTQNFGLMHHRPRLHLSFGNAAFDPFQSMYYNQGFGTFYDPYFNSFYDPMMMGYNPWGQNFAFQNRFGWGMNQANWLWGNRRFASNYYGYGVCPTTYATAYTSFNNNEILRDTRKVFKGARGSRSSGIQYANDNVSGSKSDLNNGRVEQRSRTTPNYQNNQNVNKDTWNNSRKRERGSIFDGNDADNKNRSKSPIYNNSDTNNRSNNFGNNSRNRSSNFGNSGGGNRSSGSGGSSTKSRTRGRN